MSPTASSSSSRSLVQSTVSHCVALLIIAIPVIVLHSGIKPVNRHFFCDDESIMYPLKPDTVPFYVAIAVGAAVAVVTVLIVEAIRLAVGATTKGSPITPGLERCMSERSAVFVTGVLTGYYMLAFGALCTELVTQTGKLGFGRHRPYFLSACHLNATCQPGKPYQIDSCDSTVASKLLNEARVSFPSGHSSYCMFIGTFLALFLQARLGFKHHLHALKNVAQVSLMLLAGYVCMSRVYDYRHHWSDILGGAIIGITFGVFMSFKMAAGLSVYRQVNLAVEPAVSYELVNSADQKTARSDNDMP